MNSCWQFHVDVKQEYQALSRPPPSRGKGPWAQTLPHHTDWNHTQRKENQNTMLLFPIALVNP